MRHPKRVLIVLLICVAGLAGALAWLHFSPSSSSSSSDSSDNTATLYSYKDSDLVSMSVKNTAGGYTIVPDKEATAKAASSAAAAPSGSSTSSTASSKVVFRIQELSGMSTTADTISTAAQDGYSLTAVKNLGASSGSLADYGLKNPTATITSTFKDGKKITLLVGSATPLDSSAHYVMLQGKDTVYTAGIADELLQGLPAYLSKQVTSVSLPSASSDTSSDTADMSAAFQKIDVTNQNGAFHLVRSGSGWQVNGCPADSGKVEILANAAAAVSASSAEALDPTAAQLKTYGLDKPISQLAYTSTSGSGTLLVGAEKTSGTYYVMMKGGRVVYLVESSNLTWLTQKAFDLQRTTVLENERNDLAGVTLKGGSAVYSMVISRTKNESSSTEDVPSYTYSTVCNGKKVKTESTYSSFFDKAAALKVLEASSAKPSGTPAWMLTVSGFDTKVHHTYAFYASGSRRYLVTADGVTLGLVNSTDVDAVVTAAKAVQ
mgnify:CR=1 FL=1|jgi:hypothetical protein